MDSFIIGTPGFGVEGTLNPGASGQIAIYGESNEVSGDELLTDNGTILAYTGTGGITAITATLGHVGTSGVLSLLGSTSGTCTITAPATAGTATNPIAFSNSINLSGASTVYQAQGTPGVTQTAMAVGTLATIGGIVTTFTGVSDERLKISTPYKGGLDIIQCITPIRYRWNERGQKWTGLNGTQEFVGFSANNVQKSLPEAILSTEGPDKYLSFDDRPVIAALVNAVKELTARLAVLEARA